MRGLLKSGSSLRRLSQSANPSTVSKGGATIGSGKGQGLYSPRSPGMKEPGTMAGINRGKSAYIQHNGAGYRPKESPTALSSAPPPIPYTPSGTSGTMSIDNYRKSSFHGLR